MEQGSSSKLRTTLPVVALIAGLAVLVVLLMQSVGRLPESPEALWLELQRLNDVGDTAAMWDLVDEEGKANFHRDVEINRTVLLKNPHPSNDSNFRKFSVTREEFFTLDDRALYIAENSPPARRRLMRDAKIESIRRHEKEGDWVIRWKTSWEQTYLMLVRDTGSGFTLVHSQMSGRADTAKRAQ